MTEQYFLKHFQTREPQDLLQGCNCNASNYFRKFNCTQYFFGGVSILNSQCTISQFPPQ